MATDFIKNVYWDVFEELKKDLRGASLLAVVRRCGIYLPPALEEKEIIRLTFHWMFDFPFANEGIPYFGTNQELTEHQKQVINKEYDNLIDVCLFCRKNENPLYVDMLKAQETVDRILILDALLGRTYEGWRENFLNEKSARNNTR